MNLRTRMKQFKQSNSRGSLFINEINKNRRRQSFNITESIWIHKICIHEINNHDIPHHNNNKFIYFLCKISMAALLSNGGEVEVWTSRLPAEQGGGETQSRGCEIELDKVILHLMGSDHNGSSGIGTGIYYSKTQYNSIAHLNHGIRCKNAPGCIIVLQNQTDRGHWGSNSCGQHNFGIEASTERI